MKIKVINKGHQPLPAYATPQSAGMDLRANIPSSITLQPMQRQLIGTGLYIALPPGFEAQIRPRSGFSAKGMEGYSLQDNSCNRYDADVLLGTIDKTYRGNVGVIIKSYERTPFLVKEGTRIAQMVIGHCYLGELSLVVNLSDTDRGEGGFGHTGTR